MTEKVILVDRNDNIIGYKDRNKVNYKNDIYRITQLIIENDKDEILIAQRSLTKGTCPGMWGASVAGTVEKGETYESNIIKEAKEEIGLEITGPKILHKKLLTHQRFFYCTWYTMKLNKKISDFKLCPIEVNAIKWIKRDELKKDIKDNPDKYLNSLKEVMLILKNQNN